MCIRDRAWAEELSLPAIAMLLVALHEKPNFPLATEHMPHWYGWSADTAERGLAELAKLGLLKVGKQRYKDLSLIHISPDQPSRRRRGPRPVPGPGVAPVDPH